MLRRTSVRCVHLFSALVPHSSVKGPKFLDDTQLAVAQEALREKADILRGVSLAEAFSALCDISKFQVQRDTANKLGDCIDSMRGILYKKDCTDPLQRLVLHEAIMAAGFYQRAISPTELKGESLRFVLNHFNFDVRRDVPITRTVHDSLFEDRATTEQSEHLLTDLLLLERHLFGKYRLVPSGGRRWFALGLPLSDIKTEEELDRILDLPVVKSVGNFSSSLSQDTEKLWKTIVVTPGTEPEVSFFEAAELQGTVSATDAVYELRVQKPQKPVEYWDKLREILLRYWVIWFTLWAMFFMVDEEIITLLALIFLKYKQTKILEEEAERTGGKVYVASAVGRSIG